MKELFILIFFLISISSHAMVVMKRSNCPIEFEGRVSEIITPVGAEDIFSRDQIIFENLRTLKGQVGESLTLQVLHNGPFKWEKNKDYRIQLRESKLCWVEEI